MASAQALQHVNCIAILSGAAQVSVSPGRVVGQTTSSRLTDEFESERFGGRPRVCALERDGDRFVLSKPFFLFVRFFLPIFAALAAVWQRFYCTRSATLVQCS